MTQILVTLNEDATTLHVRKAIELLRGVASVKVFKGNAEKVAEKRRQEAYVKESLTRAFDEVKRARRGEHKMMTDEEFMAELKGTIIKERRKHLGVNQQTLADLAGVGLNTLVAIERGEGNPQLNTLLTILDTLGLQMNINLKTLDYETV